jgi:hypothetical protein
VEDRPQISFCDLVSLYVAGQSASFSSQQVQIRVKHSCIAEVAFLVYFIRQAQLPTDILPFNVNFADDSHMSLRHQSPYQPASIFLDRLLSCAFHFNLALTSAMLAQVVLPRAKAFEITKETIQSPLFQSVLMSLSYEQGVSHLRLREIHLPTFLPQCGLLFRYNRFIQTLTFDRIDFTDASPVFRQMFERAHGFKPFELVFQSCGLSRPSFTSFFEALSKVDRQITSLTFRNCTFSEGVFRSVVQVIFFEHCFHALESFTIEGATLGCLSHCVLEFTCCSWAMESKCLASISVVNCGVDGVEFISQFLQFDIGLRELNLRGNSLSRPIPKLSHISVKRLDFLVLQSCRSVSLEFLLSLLALIDEHSIAVHGLDLSDLGLSKSDLSDFLSALEAHALVDLNMLKFDENPMNHSQTASLCQFLERQNELTTLSLNCSIDIGASPLGLVLLIKVIQRLPLRSLSLRSDGSMRFSFGQLLLPLLMGDAILSLEHLDVTNQCIGERGLEVLGVLLDRGALSDLYTDGASINSFDFLCRFCEKVLNSRVTFAEFPEQDFEKTLRLVEAGQDLDAMRGTADRLRDRFNRNYVPSVALAERVKKITSAAVARLPTDMKEAAARNPKSRRDADGEGMTPGGMQQALGMNQAMEQLFRECLDGQEGVNPVLALMTVMQDRLSFDALFADAANAE